MGLMSPHGAWGCTPPLGPPHWWGPTTCTHATFNTLVPHATVSICCPALVSSGDVLRVAQTPFHLPTLLPSIYFAYADSPGPGEAHTGPTNGSALQVLACCLELTRPPRTQGRSRTSDRRSQLLPRVLAVAQPLATVGSLPNCPSTSSISLPLELTQMDSFSATSRTKCKGIERLALFTTVQTLISAFCRFARLPWALNSMHHSGANVVLTSTFLCESVLKTIGLGPRTLTRLLVRICSCSCPRRVLPSHFTPHHHPRLFI